VTYLLRKEIQRNEEFKNWIPMNFVAVNGVHVLSILNTINSRLWTSEIFGLEMFTAPISDDTMMDLKFFSLISLILNDCMILVSQVYTFVFLNTFYTPSSLAFIATVCNILVTLLLQILAKVKHHRRKSGKSIELQDPPERKLSSGVRLDNSQVPSRLDVSQASPAPVRDSDRDPNPQGKKDEDIFEDPVVAGDR